MEKWIKIQKFQKKNKARYIIDVKNKYVGQFDIDAVELLTDMFIDEKGKIVKVWKEGFKK